MADDKVVLTENDANYYYDIYSPRIIQMALDSVDKGEVPDDIKEHYHNIVGYTANLIYKLAGKYNNQDQGPIIYFAIFFELLRTGNLSYTGDFVFDLPTNEFSQIQGASIIGGKGVCRNISCFYRDVLNELSKKVDNLGNSFVFATNGNMFNRRRFKNAQLNANHIEEDAPSMDTHNRPNHMDVISGIRMNGNPRFLILDPTNFHVEQLNISSKENKKQFTQELSLIWDVIYRDNYKKDKSMIKEVIDQIYGLQQKVEQYEPIDLSDEIIEAIYNVGVQSINDNLYDINNSNRIDAYKQYVKRSQEIICNYLKYDERTIKTK